MRLYLVEVSICSPQSRDSDLTRWRVLYCGYDRLEAVRVYTESRAEDYHGSYTCQARVTRARGKAVACA
jgi:hypothetical protein